ncbi:MAG: hypothetical protein Q7K43_02370 [Candidatus Woesearchaeota archaeon]|nr:hypothetical protein [Candidatus Woesearchaeota archaeon]
MVKTKDSEVIEAVVKEVAGADVIPLVKILKTKTNVNEFKLAQLLKIEVNLTRNMLYRLYNASLVSFTRKKDKKKGWYIYYWTFNTKRVQELSIQLRGKNIDRLQERLNREKSSHFFLCPSKCIRLDFEQATDFEYKCPECGALLDQENNAQKIVQLEQQISGLKESSKQEIKKPAKKVKKSKSVKK